MASYVVKEAKNRADKLTASTGKTVLPSITSQVEAQEEANQLNVINQSIIGAKEGVVEAITKLVGSNIALRSRDACRLHWHLRLDDSAACGGFAARFGDGCNEGAHRYSCSKPISAPRIATITKSSSKPTTLAAESSKCKRQQKR
jgi:hypothetical protein